MMSPTSQTLNNGAKVAVFGLGYVGSVSAACLAQLGHRIVGIDSDEYKVRSINNKCAPFFEPGLEEIVAETVSAGRLSATVSISEALDHAEIALICVGTPSERNGNLSLDQLRRVCEAIASTTASRSTPLIVAIRSTVFPGTCDDIVIPIVGANPNITVVSNPEFLREGVAVHDFLYPSLLVAGSNDSRSRERVAALYSSLNVAPCLVSLRTAEMIKYACNCFHAVKIAFANEIGALSERLGVDGQEVMETLCRDEKLNISAAYLKPGFAFGGSCLPKDLRALNYRANRADLHLPLLAAALPSNTEHLNRAIQSVLDLPSERIGVIGLAFKENTDDLRESPVIALIEHLLGKGRVVRVHDPHIRLDSIYGSNRNFVLNAIPHIGRLMEPALEDLLEWADSLVIAQNTPPEMLAAIVNSGRPVLDLTNGSAGVAVQRGAS